MSASKTSGDQAERIVGALTADTSPLRERALTTLLDFVLDAPLSTWIAPDEIVTLLIAAATGPNAATSIERHVRPGWERHLARCEETQDTLGKGLPDETRKRIGRLIVETPPPKAEWTKDMVDQKLVQRLFAPVAQEFLLGFAKRLPIPGLSGFEDPSESRSGFGLRNRLKQSVEKRAATFVEAGKSMLGGMERQIQTLAKDFSESAGRDVRRAMIERLKSEEGHALASQIVLQALDHVLDTPLAELNRDTADLPWDDIWALVPAVVEHNRERAPIVDALRAELHAWLEVDGERSARALLDEAGTLDVTVASALSHFDAPVRDFFGSDGFRGWLDEALQV